MQPKEYVASAFAVVILLLFCSPIFALAAGLSTGVSPADLRLKMFVGITNSDVIASLHSLLLPLVGAVVVFRSDYFLGWFGTLILCISCLAIVLGFFVFIATNPDIFGQDPRFSPYIEEYQDVHKSIFQMIGMLTLLFLAKLGLSKDHVQGRDSAPAVPAGTASPAEAKDTGQPASPAAGAAS